MLLTFHLFDPSYCHRSIVILLRPHHQAAINSGNSTCGSLPRATGRECPGDWLAGVCRPRPRARLRLPHCIQLCPSSLVLSVCPSDCLYTLSLSTSKLTISLKLLNSQKPKTQTVESLKYTFFPGREFECTPSWDAPCQVHCPQCTEMLQTRLKSTYN